MCKKKKGKELREDSGGAKETGGEGKFQNLRNNKTKYCRSKFQLRWLKPKSLSEMECKLREVKNVGKE